MSKQHEHHTSGKEQHQRHEHHDHQHHATKRRLHHDWRFWVAVTAVILMLASMVVYVFSLDESLRPGAGVQPRVPAAAE